jgi:hypothetical protein
LPHTYQWMIFDELVAWGMVPLGFADTATRGMRSHEVGWRAGWGWAPVARSPMVVGGYSYSTEPVWGLAYAKPT